MENNTKVNKLVLFVVFFCLLAALISFSISVYVLLKAELGQYLLVKTWEKHVGELNIEFSSLSKVNKPWPWADFYPAAELRFDRFNVSQIVLNNDSGQALAFGPGFNNFAQSEHESHSVMVISAHNDSHFSILQKLRLDDKVTLTLTSGQQQNFNVYKIEVLNLDSEQLIIDTTVINSDLITHKDLVLVTCYPFGVMDNNSNFRYIVYLS